MWNYMKPRLAGHWQRYELITPSGHPDVKGSWDGQIYYIENKVGDAESWTADRRKAALRPDQLLYIEWLLQSDQRVFVAFGHPSEKRIVFYGRHYQSMDWHQPQVPLFYRP